MRKFLTIITSLVFVVAFASAVCSKQAEAKCGGNATTSGTCEPFKAIGPLVKFQP